MRFNAPLDMLMQSMALASDLKHSDLFDKGLDLFLSRGIDDEKRVTSYFSSFSSINKHYSDNLLHDYNQFKLKFAANNQGSASREDWINLNYNVYARRFESKIAKGLIEHPVPEMSKAAQTMGMSLIRDVDSCLENRTQRQAFLDHLISRIDSDTRPWFKDAPRLLAFKEKRNMSALRDILKNSKRGHEIISIAYLSVKIAESLERTAIDCDTLVPEWKDVADSLYGENILKKRSTGLKTETAPDAGYGTRLPDHPPYTPTNFDAVGPNWTIAKPIVENIRPFAKKAIRAGYPVICGLSGSMFLMSVFMHYIHNKHKSFDKGAATLCALAFLVYDGGHSLNEIITIHHAFRQLLRGPLIDKPDNSQWRAWRQNVDDYEFRYNDLIRLARSRKSEARINQILHSSANSAVNFFHKYDARACENLGLIDTMRGGASPLPSRYAEPPSGPNQRASLLSCWSAT